MSGIPRDTTVEAWRIRRGIIAAMTPEERLRTALELGEAVHEIRIAGLLDRNPGWSRRDAVRRLIFLDTGVALPETE